MGYEDSPQATLLYDADCGFCQWTVGAVLAWDRARKLRPLAIQSGEGAVLLAHLDRDEQLGSWHLVMPEGDVFSAGAALAPLLRLLRGGRPFASIAERRPDACTAGYRFVASRRSLFGRLVRGPAAARARARINERSARRT